MNIYFISCQENWPVGNAGAVIAANTPEEAISILPKDCHKPSAPEIIGTTTKRKYPKPTVIFYNSTEY